MKREVINGMSITAILSVAAIFVSYTNMTENDKMYGGYGLMVLFIGAFEAVIGIVLSFIRRTRRFADGILISASLTLLVGGSICSNVIRI